VIGDCYAGAVMMMLMKRVERYGFKIPPADFLSDRVSAKKTA